MRPVASALGAGLAVAALVFLASPAAAEPFLTDATGDATVTVTVSGTGTGAPVAAEQVESVDIRGLDVAEDELNLVLTLTAGGSTTPAGYTYYFVQFDWSGTLYRVEFYHAVSPGLGEFTGAYLTSYQDGYFRYVADLEGTFDPAAGTYAATLPKAYVLGPGNKIPLTGDELRGAFVESGSFGIGFNFIVDWELRLSDRMPDEGEAVYEVRGGGEATGHLVLGSAYPVRVSNGGATTFVFEATLRNAAAFEDNVKLELIEVPTGWRGTVAASQRVAAGADKELSVLMSVPFAHEHGGFQSFKVVATSEKDPTARASLRLGVLHTPTPMPEGHHPDLFLHGENYDFPVFSTVFPYVGPYMNTLSDHANDAEAASVNGYGRSPSGGARLVWRVPLAPELALGLDFDMARTGALVGAIKGGGPADALVSAELLLTRGNNDDEGLLLARTAEPAAVTLDAQGTVPFELTIVPQKAADYVPWAPQQNLVLAVYVDDPGPTGSFCCFGPQQPGLAIGEFKLSLPLNEYDDVLTGIDGVASAVSLVAEGPLERSVRPGAVATYDFTIRNDGLKEESFTLSVQGNDAERGTVVPDRPIRLETGASDRVLLAVSLPAEATNGQVFDVILMAIAKSDPSVLAVARTKTTALAAADPTTDDSAILLAAQEEAAESATPGPAAVLVLGVLASVAGVYRTRVERLTWPRR